MSSYTFLCILVILGSFNPLVSESPAEGQCADHENVRTALTVSVNRKFNVTKGEWGTEFSAQHIGPGNTTGNVELDGTHTVLECDNRRAVHMKMVVTEKEDSNPNITSDLGLVGIKPKTDRIKLHHRHGSNIIVFNNGLSAQRLNMDDPLHCCVFSNRPLRDNELFEVRLDKRTTHRAYCQGIGVMVHSPVDVKLMGSMYQSEGVWMYHDDSIYSKNKKLKDRYGLNIYNLQAGDKIGVMRKTNGNVHFSVNGVDQGAAIINTPANLYGVYEVRGDAIMATIVS